MSGLLLRQIGFVRKPMRDLAPTAGVGLAFTHDGRDRIHEAQPGERFSETVMLKAR